MQVETIFKYFPELDAGQRNQFRAMAPLYRDWNLKINVVSRKDIDELYLRHVLHSLAIAKVHRFEPNSAVLDVGTGGGFPGIPLAISFPDVQFTLVDSIGKKIKVVDQVVEGLHLKNVKTINARVEELNERYDFIVSRAVAAMPTFVHWVENKVKKKSVHKRKNGILYLKGGDLSEELKNYRAAEIFELADFFEEAFFATKKLVYLPLSYKN